ncbi:MAG: nitroreductase family protein [Anaerolineae bacterium]
MNPIIEMIHNRRSVRAFEPREVSTDIKTELIQATLRAPTAGNLMLYSIIDIQEQAVKDALAISCDNQPFIAQAPIVWLFLADYQRWYDYFIHSGVEERCAAGGVHMRKPAEGDLMLACCDALIAAQTAVIAAESLGLGSCYIGDIMENYEVHRDLFRLPRYVFPISLLCMGYPTEQQKSRRQTTRFGDEYIVFKNRYHRLSADEFSSMFESEYERTFNGRERADGIENVGQLIYARKFNAEYSKEMSRSVQVILSQWLEE